MLEPLAFGPILTLYLYTASAALAQMSFVIATGTL
jgi:hypothetical protein